MCMQRSAMARARIGDAARAIARSRPRYVIPVDMVGSTQLILWLSWAQLAALAPLLSLGSSEALAAAATTLDRAIPLFRDGMSSHWDCYRAPALVNIGEGIILAFAHSDPGSCDSTKILSRNDDLLVNSCYEHVSPGMIRLSIHSLQLSVKEVQASVALRLNPPRQRRPASPKSLAALTSRCLSPLKTRPAAQDQAIHRGSDFAGLG